MVRFLRARNVWPGFVASLALVTTAVQGQGLRDTPAGPVDAVQVLIDRLTELDQQDTGYSASTSGSAFLPLGQSETSAMLLFQKPHASSDAMKSLVKLGAKALPALVKHLRDGRPTRISLAHKGGIGGMIIS